MVVESGERLWHQPTRVLSDCLVLRLLIGCDGDLRGNKGGRWIDCGDGGRGSVVVVMATSMMMERRSRLDWAGDRLAKGRWCTGLVSEANMCTILTMLLGALELPCGHLYNRVYAGGGAFNVSEDKVNRGACVHTLPCLCCLENLIKTQKGEGPHSFVSSQKTRA